MTLRHPSNTLIKTLRMKKRTKIRIINGTFQRISPLNFAPQFEQNVLAVGIIRLQLGQGRRGAVVSSPHVGHRSSGDGEPQNGQTRPYPPTFPALVCSSLIVSLQRLDEQIISSLFIKPILNRVMFYRASTSITPRLSTVCL